MCLFQKGLWHMVWFVQRARAYFVLIRPLKVQPTCHVQPTQRRHAVRSNNRPKQPLGIENNGPRLFCLDCQGAMAGNCSGQVVRACG